MKVEVQDDVKFSFEHKSMHNQLNHLLTIWTGESGYIEICLRDDELKKLKECLE